MLLLRGTRSPEKNDGCWGREASEYIQEEGKEEKKRRERGREAGRQAGEQTGSLCNFRSLV